MQLSESYFSREEENVIFDSSDKRTCHQRPDSPILRIVLW